MTSSPSPSPALTNLTSPNLFSNLEGPSRREQLVNALTTYWDLLSSRGLPLTHLTVGLRVIHPPTLSLFHRTLFRLKGLRRPFILWMAQEVVDRFLHQESIETRLSIAEGQVKTNLEADNRLIGYLQEIKCPLVGLPRYSQSHISDVATDYIKELRYDKLKGTVAGTPTWAATMSPELREALEAHIQGVRDLRET